MEPCRGASFVPSRSLKLLPILGAPSLPSREYPLPFSSAVRRGDSGFDTCLRLPSLLEEGKAAELAEESECCDCCSTRSLSLPLFLLLEAGSVLPVMFWSRRSAFAAKSRGSPRKVALGSEY